MPGDRASSELWLRITDDIDPMPPADQHNALNADQVALIGAWIDAGASYAPHWAYVAPQPGVAPAVTDEAWPRDDIDRHLLRRLEREGLTPAPDADRVTLLRRLTFDLTGLPPTPAEVDAFLAGDDSAYAANVDRLLASPRFGERLAMYWLDLVRYADTVGYHGDQTHRIWPYRDYVINAFNANKPFDQFTIEQLAGDLLPEPTQDQLVATGYNRLLQTTHEGGAQLMEYRAIYQADRVRNVSSVWMGATVGCAQCHDHKYDPFTARDFYALGAFFADIDDEEHLRNQYDGLNTLPTRRTPEMRVTTDASQRADAALVRALDRAQADVSAAIDALPASRAAWETALRGEIATGSGRETTWIDDRLDTGGRTQGDWTFVTDGPVPAHSGEAYRIQSSNGRIQHYVVEATSGTLTVAEGDTLFAWVHLAADRPPGALMLQFNVAGDWQHRAVWGSDDIDYGRRDADWAGYQRQGALPQPGAWVRLEIAAESVGLAPGDVISGMAFTQFGGTVYWDAAGIRSNQAAPAAVAEALTIPPAERTAQQRAAIADHHAATDPAVVAARARVADLESQRRTLAESLPRTMYTRAIEPRDVRLLPAGNWLDESGPLVEPAVPVFMGSLGGDERASRLDLAEWLVTPVASGGSGEYTARVMVNRIWALFFGQGLCPSLEDFGGQGRPPTHPELLDQLALDFVASGWDLKALIRRLVMTRAYRQSARATDELVARDPENLLFARQSRSRYPAEMIRDTVLSVSGLLVNEIGGPSVHPPQPAGHYRHLNFPPRKYRADMGPEQWRRGLYVHWQRQFLHPTFRAFDAPTREDCTPWRNVSNTPTAALALLNDPVFVEAARVFAAQLAGSGQPRRDVIAGAMRAVTSRTPDDAEVDILLDLLERSERHYRANPEAAAALIALGSAERTGEVDAAAIAAWTQVARALFNLHEMMTRE